MQKKSRFEIIDIPSLESREKSASFKGRSWVSLEGKKKMAARIFGKRNILVNNQSDRDRFLDFVLEFPGSKRGKGEREREERVFAASTRVHEAVNGRFAGKWKLDERRALATGPFTAAHAEESSAFGDRERKEEKKKKKKGKTDCQARVLPFELINLPPLHLTIGAAKHRRNLAKVGRYFAVFGE